MLVLKNKAVIRRPGPRLIASTLALLTLCAACGGGRSGVGSSGVDSSKVAQELTNEEAMDLCMWLEEGANSYRPTEEQFCIAISAELAPNADKCEAAVPSCRESLKEAEDELDEPVDYSCEKTASDLVSNCTGTVGEIEACYRDALDVNASYIEKITCMDAGRVKRPSTPRSCETLKKSCPRLALE